MSVLHTEPGVLLSLVDFISLNLHLVMKCCILRFLLTVSALLEHVVDNTDSNINGNFYTWVLFSHILGSKYLIGTKHVQIDINKDRQRVNTFS